MSPKTERPANDLKSNWTGFGLSNKVKETGKSKAEIVRQEASAKVKSFDSGSIRVLTQKSLKGDIKQMQGYKDGRQRSRAGKYRVIYRLHRKEKKKSWKHYIAYSFRLS